ncbi:MAG TPA: PilZ domain-containing protein [Terriglobales bacterium]|nr:PilZ domain-containing protein [Terriglobales bacterium]
MLLQSMVLSRDTDKVAVLMRAFSRLDIDVVVCSDPSSAIALMDRKKFEAVVIDFGVPGSDSLLHDICRQQTNVMVAAILNPQTTAREAFALGARFVLYEPITMDRALQGLRAVRSLLYPQRRQQLRKPAYAPVCLRFIPGREIKAVVLNISEGGIAVRLPEPATVRQTVRARFSLPGIHDAIDVQGQIAWVDKNGRAGIRFLHVPSHLHGQLKQWLFPTLPDSKIVR